MSHIPLPRGQRDWASDYSEGRGGCYESTCLSCGLQFFGWKGRRECRECAAKRGNATDAMLAAERRQVLDDDVSTDELIGGNS